MSEAISDRRALKDRILEAALLHAAFDGWGRRTLMNAASDAGADADTARRLFPQGGDSLLKWLDDWADRQMLAGAPADLDQLPVRRRIVALVRARFAPLAGHREAMRRAGLARGFPRNLPGTGRSVWRTVDRMWTAAGLAGDGVESFSYYSRRATLATVLCATFVYWLEDQSEGSQETWAFLDRRIEDVMRLGRARSQLEGLLGRFRPGAAGRPAQ